MFYLLLFFFDDEVEGFFPGEDTALRFPWTFSVVQVIEQARNLREVLIPPLPPPPVFLKVVLYPGQPA